MLQFSNLAIEVAVANQGGAPESDTGLKNERSSKSQKNRGNVLTIKKLSLLLSFIASMTVITSCDEKEIYEKIDDGIVDDNRESGTFIRMNIEDANTLFITSTNSSSKLYGVKKSSLKSTSEIDGEIYEINCFDENEEPIEKRNPSHIFDAGDFVIVMFGYDECYFVNKTNGLIYAIPHECNPTYWEFHPTSEGIFFNSVFKLQVDKNNNVYYVANEYPYNLYQVSSITSGSIQFKQVSAVNDKVYGGFCVDKDGNILYSYSGDWGATNMRMRYRKIDGSFVNLLRYNPPYETHPVIWEYLLNVWTGTDGIMYGIMKSNDENKPTYLFKIQDGQIIKIRNVSKYMHELLKSFFYSFTIHDVFYVQGRIICNPISYFTQYTGNKSEYLIDISSESLYKEIPCSVQPNMVLNDQLCSFDDKAFSCTLIDIDTGKTSLLYDLDESKLSNYDIDKIMSVTDSGVVFSAVQLSDGNYIVAKIGLDNSVTIQQTIEGKVTIVMPLNL